MVVRGCGFSSPPLTPASTTYSLTLFLFSLNKEHIEDTEHIEQGICTRAWKGRWTFVKRFDCTAGISNRGRVHVWPRHKHNTTPEKDKKVPGKEQKTVLSSMFKSIS